MCIAMELTKGYLTSFIAPLFIGQSEQLPPPPPPQDRLQAEVERLRREFIAYILTGAEPDSEAGRLVVAKAGVVQSTHEKDLERCHRSLDLDRRPENAEVILQTIAKECLESAGRCNWGRVVAVLAFSRLVAVRRMHGAGESTGDRLLIEGYAVSTADFLARFVLEWSRDVGEGDLGPARLDAGRSSIQWLSGCFATVLKVGAVAASYANEAIR